MINDQTSYRQILKSTSLFGGVQFLNIIISIIRSKFAAILIGPIGIGIVGLLNATLNLIGGFTNLGLEISAVREISFSKENADNERVSRIIIIFKRLIWVTGIFGAILTIILSSWLSEFTFNNNNYTISFIWISIALLFRQLSAGQLSILQGLRRLRNLAKANLLGSFLSLLITIPLYYYFRIEGIVPVIILTSFISFILAWYFTRKIKIKRQNISTREVIIEGKRMIQLGITLSISSFITLIAAYIMQIFITNRGGIIEVGFYNAAFIIINSYVGLIFNAMSKDYFPRLSAISEKDNIVRKIVVEQALIGVLLITPIIIAFLTFAPTIIEMLYTKEFISIIGMVSFGILGTLFKVVSWAMGYVIIAKGDSKVFIKTAIGFNSLLLLMNILGYTYYGLTGIGVSFFLYYIIHFIGIKLIISSRYKFYFDRGFYKIFRFSIILCVLTFILSYIQDLLLMYILMIGMILLSSIYSFYHLDKKINLKELIFNLFKKKK